MAGIDETRQFIPLRIAVLTVSDTRSLDEDKSGAILAERIAKAGHAVADRKIVTDDIEKIRAQVQAWIADPTVDVVISVIKAALFGLSAGLIACYKGISVGGGPAGVGNAVNETVVFTFMALFAINIIARFFWDLGFALH